MNTGPRGVAMRLDEASVLIAGGTSGLGPETARQFTAAGVRRTAFNGCEAARGEATRRTLAMEAKRFGVRVNALTPSPVEGTPVYDRVRATGFGMNPFDQAAAAAHLGLALPGDLAALAVFLAGPQAARLAGQVISLNGGNFGGIDSSARPHCGKMLYIAGNTIGTAHVDLSRPEAHPPGIQG
jgi:NAD(P)-dependent dehydrogenase (short-subunit alcohol dehydrogenase family)